MTIRLHRLLPYLLLLLALALAPTPLGAAELDAEAARLWSRAKSAMNQGLQRAALQPLKRALQLAPDAISIHCDYQDLMVAQGFAVDLVQEYKARRDAEPSNADWHYLYGRSTGDPSLAKEAFVRALVLAPEHKWARQGLGGVAAVTGKLDEALEHYQAAAVIDPSFATAHNKIAGIHYARGEFVEAKVAWQAAIAASPTDYHAYLNMGAVLSMEGDLEGAADLLGQSVARAPGNPLAYVNLGYVLFKLRRYDLALANFAAALAINPRDRKVAGSKRLVESVRAGTMPFEAFAPYEKALAIAGKDAKRAAQHLREVVLLAPSFATAHSHLGMALLTLGEVDSGLDSLRKAITLEPGEPGLLYNLGYALMGTEDYAGALPRLQEAHEADPGDLDILSSLALCQMARGSSEDAIQTFGKALSIQPRDPVLWVQLASAQGSHGDLRSAADSAGRALTIAPGFTTARMQRVSILKEDRRFAEALEDLTLLEAESPGHPDLAKLRSAIEHAHVAHSATASKAGHLRLSRIFVSRKSTADRVGERLAGGTSFEELARAFGEGDEKSRSGDIGYLDPTELRSELLGPVKSLKPGRWVGPITLGSAWVFLKRTD